MPYKLEGVIRSTVADFGAYPRPTVSGMEVEMRADAFPLDTVLGEKQQWVVPVYQRHYEWETGEDRQLPKLWDDLRDKTIERLEDRRPFPHYFGAILFSEPVNQPFGAVRQRFLVDGQQRITTFQLTLAAIREVARNHQIMRLIDVIEAYILNEISRSMVDPDREQFKLWPSTFDRNLFLDIIGNTPDDLRSKRVQYFYKNGNLIKGQAPKMLRAYWYLLGTVDAFVAERQEDGDNPETVLDALLAGFLSGFQIVVIQLDQNDDAQEIFASLNGLGKPLSPFDLIRNDVFHRARKTGEDDQKLFDQHWKPFENPFWSEEVRQGRLKRARADHLIAHSVVAETARDVNVGKIATEYQHYARERSFPTVAEELQVLVGHAATYRAMEQRIGIEVIGRIASVLRIWDLTTFHPLILWINAQELEDEEKIRLFDLLESYIVRREICGLTTKNYNKVVTGIIKNAAGADDKVGAVFRHVVDLSGDASRMPSDAQLAEAFAKRKAYGAIPAPRLRHIMESIEYAKRTKFDEVAISTANLTVEHVLPQSWAENWPLANGITAPCQSTWELAFHGHEVSDETKALMERRQQVVDTFGNLTVLTQALNPSIGNAGWDTKRTRLGNSLLVLNREIAAQAVWDEGQIEQRSLDLARTARKIWRA